MQFLFKSTVLTFAVARIAYASPLGDSTDDTSVAEGCTRNTGTHCSYSSANDKALARVALADLLSLCSNGNFAGSAKRVASASFDGVVAYACNGFCRGNFIPCQDAEYSINRVINGCDHFGWDSQESRGTWFGIAMDGESPCGYRYTGKGATF